MTLEKITAIIMRKVNRYWQKYFKSERIGTLEVMELSS